MKIYLYSFIFLTLFLIICELKILPKNWYKKISLFYFLFIFGQRWSAGVDFYGYLRYYITGFKTEIGYRIIQNYFFQNNIYFGILVFIIYFFTTTVSLWFFLKFIKSNYGVYVFFLSEYHIMSINPLRTYIAINFFLIGLYNLYFYKKTIKCFLFIFLGSLFHKIIFFIIPFLLFFKNFKIKNKNNIIKIIIGILVILPVVPFYEVLKICVDYIPRYGKYIGSRYDVPLSYLNIVRYYIILSLFILFYNKKSIEKKKYIFITIGMILFIFITGVSISFAPLHRVAYFFKIFEILYFVYSYENLKINYKKSIILFVFFINYLFIVHKDMGKIKYYELKILHLYNHKTYSEYMKEIENNKINSGVKLRVR